MRLLLIGLLLLVALPASAQIYKYIDANGNITYSNVPPPDGRPSEIVVLPPFNSVEPQPRTQPPLTTPGTPRAPVHSTYDVLELTDLPTDEALRANNGTFTVTVRMEPRLVPGQLLRLVLDGKPYGQPSNVPRLQLVNIDRGDHYLAVQVLNNGEVIQQSQPTKFTLQRVHLGR
ncbi:DUF4124 domain-containing protein [Pseudomonas sp. R5(2019)]|uniref:DUF4124 domain-containing protein n=1 Tax=Pseudomonas sp. R5(2019) TaxID=2697566 RepID=UPI0014128464|nr:DUF4124 domain-containing protein [Pseudomonas sp. R5(2019)]NBA94126.1 DUF4124 domain-containing protein [Pseudomonas sp. R5(2019)]